jgi:hypothetical protein
MAVKSLLVWFFLPLLLLLMVPRLRLLAEVKSSDSLSLLQLLYPPISLLPFYANLDKRRGIAVFSFFLPFFLSQKYQRGVYG